MRNTRGTGKNQFSDTVTDAEVKQNGVEKAFQLVNFADAGQNKQPYAVVHEGIEEKSEDSQKGEHKK